MSLITYDENNITFSDSSSMSVSNIAPIDLSGIIIMWSGNTIPNGWVLCDGTNNTPNLSGKFLVGVDEFDTAFSSSGNTGGEKRHTLTISELPAHTHTMPYDTLYSTTSGGHNDQHEAQYIKQNDLTTTTDTIGGSGSHENLPPYYVLSYIMCKASPIYYNATIYPTGAYTSYLYNNRRYYVLTENGTFQTNFSDRAIEYLLVGGGGGGGPIYINNLSSMTMGGGGGGGQVVHGSFVPNKNEIYNVTIGNGGIGANCMISSTLNTTLFATSVVSSATTGGQTSIKNSTNVTISYANGGSPGDLDAIPGGIVGIGGTMYQNGGNPYTLNSYGAILIESTPTANIYAIGNEISGITFGFYYYDYNPPSNGYSLDSINMIYNNNGTIYTHVGGGGGNGNPFITTDPNVTTVQQGGSGGGGNGGSGDYLTNGVLSGVFGTSGVANTGGGGGGAGQYDNYFKYYQKIQTNPSTNFSYNVNSYNGGSGVLILVYDM